MMTRTSLILVSALNLVAAGCLPPDSGTSTSGDGYYIPPASPSALGVEPVVGKLKFNDRVVNLTPEVFADETQGVPRDATAKIIADIDVGKRQDGERRSTGDDFSKPERLR